MTTLRVDERTLMVGLTEWLVAAMPAILFLALALLAAHLSSGRFSLLGVEQVFDTLLPTDQMLWSGFTA
jgi:hypothetical protein